MLTLDDQKLRAVYSQLQLARLAIGELFHGVHYENFVDTGRYRAIAMPAVMLASEHMLAVANNVNRFCYDLHTLAAWQRVLETLDEDDRLIALFEFVAPIATSCLSLPYSIRQMLIKSICHLSYRTNRFRMSDWDEAGLKHDRELRFADAKKLSAPFSSWPSMCTAFARLNNSKFTDTSDDYRNRLHHGFPRRIELGHIMTIQRDPKSFVYRICDQPPLFISDLVPLLADQYQAAVDCYVAYVALVREQRGFWAPRAGSVDATAEQRAASATSLSRT